MNKKLQNAIREFIGDDPAKAVERVRTDRIFARRLLERANGDNGFVKLVHSPQESMFLDCFGLAAYGAGLAALLQSLVTQADGTPTDFNHVGMALAATADAETRIAAMLWAAAWIIEPELEETK